MAEAACINVVDGAVVMCPCVNPDDVADTDTGTDTVVDNAEVPAAAPGIELAPVIKKIYQIQFGFRQTARVKL